MQYKMNITCAVCFVETSEFHGSWEVVFVIGTNIFMLSWLYFFNMADLRARS